MVSIFWFYNTQMVTRNHFPIFFIKWILAGCCGYKLIICTGYYFKIKRICGCKIFIPFFSQLSALFDWKFGKELSQLPIARYQSPLASLVQ